MVERIVETFAEVLDGSGRTLDEAVFILGPDFGEGVRRQLADICERHGLAAGFAVQERALGTAHAVIQAADALDGECILVFADTLFSMAEAPDLDADAVVWVKHVDDPRRFGVVVKEGGAEGGRITAFVEKPQEPISNEAIIGIYYVRDAATLRQEIQYLLDHDVTGAGGEYQLTDALDRMLKAGQRFKTAAVSEWLDAGTMPALKETTWVVLDKDGEARQEGTVEHSTLVEPVFVGPEAVVRGSVVGPYVAIHGKATVTGSSLRNTIVFEGATVEQSALDDAVVGHHAHVRGFAGRLNVGDHATVGVED
jgi:glucose-1-phosphate thymidylyltransferase